MFLAVMMVMSISADAISYKIARNDALFLSDKMAHELSLTKEQYEAVYEINLDYLMCLDTHAEYQQTCRCSRATDGHAWRYGGSKTHGRPWP